MANTTPREHDILQYTPSSGESANTEQQLMIQTGVEWSLDSSTNPEMPDMLALTSHPWNEITSAFNGGWSPEPWQFFSAPNFNNE
jgi:hypothetical protein